MRLIKVLDKVTHSTQPVFECDTCHGVIIDNGFDSFDEAIDSKRIHGMPCYLCDEHAPLSKRYSMALDTLAWAARGKRDWVSGEKCGFPSIGEINLVGDFAKIVEVHFSAGEVFCFACTDSIRVGMGDGHKCVEAALGELGERLTARGIAEELVSRVIADLAAQGKEAK